MIGYIISFSPSSFAISTFTQVQNTNYQTDSETLLDWLDLSATRGQSRDTALANNPGWSIATISQLNDLLHRYFDVSDANLITPTVLENRIQTSTNGNSTQWISLFGSTFDGNNAGYYQILDEFEAKDRYPYLLATSSNDTFTLAWTDKDGFSSRGTFLVRQSQVSSVPLPAAVWLMSSGFLGLLGYRRINKAQVTVEA